MKQSTEGGGGGREGQSPQMKAAANDPTKDIPLGARIVAIADAYDTLTSERVYKKARTPEEAFQEIERCSSAQFDPELVRMFVSRLRHRPHPLVEPALAPEREVLS